VDILTNLPEEKYPQIMQQLRGEVPDYDEKIGNLTKIAFPIFSS
jgi:hypothetical protein